MPRSDRLKLTPPLGRLPTLQFILVGELQVDPEYQRSLEARSSQRLIRRVAQHWNWDLCQPLVVARRPDGGGLFVIDGQHRLQAAKLRGDIAQLPCVVVEYASAADEAASFVHLNQERRPLSKLDLFKAAVASGDSQATAIADAMKSAGLSCAPHGNFVSWKPGMVSNIGGIERAWKDHGPEATSRAFDVLARAFEGQVLRYAGTIFPGIAALCAETEDADELDLLVAMIGGAEQAEWRKEIAKARAEDPDLKFAAASEQVLSNAWDEALGEYLDEAA